MVKIRTAHSAPIASITPRSRTVANGRKERAALARLPRKLYRQLYAELDRVRKLPRDKRLIAGAELLAIIFELSDELGAVSLAIRGVLELEATP